MSNNGAGVCILESELTSDKLKDNLYRILFNKDVLEEMEKNSALIGKPNAVKGICDVIEDLVKNK